MSQPGAPPQEVAATSLAPGGATASRHVNIKLGADEGDGAVG
jgi:hypothetical protein